MNTATLQQINQCLFHEYDHYITLNGTGKCKLVAIHGHDQSTNDMYAANPGKIIVTLKPLSGGEHIRLLPIDEHTIFELRPAK